MSEPDTMTDLPTGPVVVMSAKDGDTEHVAADAACAGKAALQQSAVSVNASMAEQRISAMLEGTIFDRVTPAFMLPSPKDRADFADKIVSPSRV
jgi:hypothetical protein